MPCSKSKDIQKLTCIPFVRNNGIDENNMNKNQIDDASRKKIATNFSQRSICNDSSQYHQSPNQNMTEIATNATNNYLCTDRRLFSNVIHLSSNNSTPLDAQINYSG